MTEERIVMRKRTTVVMLAIGCWLALGGAAAAQDDASDLAKAAQNPLASLVSLPLQFNFNQGVGPHDRTNLNLNVQPVIPFPGEKWNVIARTIMPVKSVPLGATESEFGIGDTTMQLFFSPAKASKLTWGIGPIFGLPTASNPQILGSEQWSLGPSAVLFYSVGKWTMGGVASNLWSVAGAGDRADVNLLTAQVFCNYNLGSGWAVGTAPIFSANWQADSGNQWTIPWGLQISKVTRFGSQPVNLVAGYYDNSEHPEGGPDSKVFFQMNLMFPTKK